MRTWLYHKTLPAAIYDKSKDDMEKLHNDGWRDSPSAFVSDKHRSIPILELPVVKPIATKKKI